MRPLKSKVNLTLDEDLLEKLRYYAEEDYRPLSQYVNIILVEYIKKLENENQ